MHYWLIKTEPTSFSIQDLAKAPKKTTFWEGVRNYQARNFLRAMKVGDLAIFYHSNAEPPAAAGVAKIVREAYPDPTAWDEKSKYFDAKASPDNPIWSMVDVQLVEVFKRPIPIDELRSVSSLAGMEILKRGSRLSVTPVTAAEFRTIEKLSRATTPTATRAVPAADSRATHQSPGRSRR
jgi:predicted RNA-binding protein with PUA-like domain